MRREVVKTQKEGDEERKSWIAGFWLIWLFIQLNKKSFTPTFSKARLR